jgi:flagellar motor switch/type III secretory pathway protein FliN
MSAAVMTQPEARTYDPRREQGARLMEAAQRLGGRFCEAVNEAMAAWLGTGYELAFKGSELLYHAPAACVGRVAWSAGGAASGVQRVLADPAVFFRFYEGMLSGSALTPTHARRLGPTEAGLGTELAARWLACLPGLASPKAADLKIMAEEDAAPLPDGVWPLLCLTLELRPGGEGQQLMLWIPLSMLEGTQAHRESAPSSQRLAQAPVKVQAVLGVVRLRLKELYELRVGDCVMLENGPQDEAVLLLSHQPVFKVRPGRQGRHLAVQVTGTAESKR